MCSSCKHADCSSSQGGRGLSFTLFPGYGGSNHWALRSTKPPPHSRHVNVATSGAVILMSSMKSNFRSARWCINDNVRSSYHHSRLAIGFRKKHHHGFKASRVPASINRTTNTASGSCNRCTGKYFRNFPLATEAISSPCMDVPYQIGYLPKLGTFLQSLIRYANIVQKKKFCTAAQ